MLQHSIEQGIVEKFAEFIYIEGKSRTVVLQPSSITKQNTRKIKMENTTRHEDLKIWRRKHKKTNKYYVTATKVKMKGIEGGLRSTRLGASNC